MRRAFPLLALAAALPLTLGGCDSCQMPEAVDPCPNGYPIMSDPIYPGGGHLVTDHGLQAEHGWYRTAKAEAHCIYHPDWGYQNLIDVLNYVNKGTPIPAKYDGPVCRKGWLRDNAKTCFHPAPGTQRGECCTYHGMGGGGGGQRGQKKQDKQGTDKSVDKSSSTDTAGGEGTGASGSSEDVKRTAIRKKQLKDPNKKPGKTKPRTRGGSVKPRGTNRKEKEVAR